MALIEKTTVVDAPVETVFDYVDDPTNVPDVAPGVDRVEIERRTDERIGDSFRLIYSVLGIDFPMTLVGTAYERPHTLESRMEGPMSGTFRWNFREIDTTKTELSVRIEYEVKGGAAGRAVDSLVLERVNEKNAQRMIENVKQRAESIEATGVKP